MKIFAILPAYRAEKTLVKFLSELPWESFTGVILVDDVSLDETYKLALEYKKIHRKKIFSIYQNAQNLGYGGNLKRCLSLALDAGADTIIELHPDGEYGLDGIAPAIREIKSGADLVLGNRFTGGKPEGMYWSKYLVSRGLTAFHNLCFRSSMRSHTRAQPLQIADLHQGFRVYTRRLLEQINYQNFSSDYIFSFQIIVAAVKRGLIIKSVPVTAHYSGAKRGAGWGASVRYVWETLGVLFKPETWQGRLICA